MPSLAMPAIPAWLNLASFSPHFVFARYRPELDPVLKGVTFSVKGAEKVRQRRPAAAAAGLGHCLASTAHHCQQCCRRTHAAKQPVSSRTLFTRYTRALPCTCPGRDVLRMPSVCCITLTARPRRRPCPRRSACAGARGAASPPSCSRCTAWLSRPQGAFSSTAWTSPPLGCTTCAPGCRWCRRRVVLIALIASSLFASCCIGCRAKRRAAQAVANATGSWIEQSSCSALLNCARKQHFFCVLFACICVGRYVERTSIGDHTGAAGVHMAHMGRACVCALTTKLQTTSSLPPIAKAVVCRLY